MQVYNIGCRKCSSLGEVHTGSKSFPDHNVRNLVMVSMVWTMPCPLTWRRVCSKGVC